MCVKGIRGGEHVRALDAKKQPATTCTANVSKRECKREQAIRWHCAPLGRQIPTDYMLLQ